MSIKKQEPKRYHLNFSASLTPTGSLNKSAKRGDISTGYLIWAYALFLTILFSIIAVLNLNIILKVVLIILVVILLFRFIFFHSRIRNYLIGVIKKIQDFKENS